jgi:hypothetical protein
MESGGEYAWRASNPSPQVVSGKDLGNLTAVGGAESGAAGSGTDSHSVANDPDLSRLLAAWPTLAEPIRLAILALVESGL